MYRKHYLAIFVCDVAFKIETSSNHSRNLCVEYGRPISHPVSCNPPPVPLKTDTGEGRLRRPRASLAPKYACVRAFAPVGK